MTSPELGPATSRGPRPEHGPEPGPELGYEQARDELAEVVRKLEAGGLSLEDSLALWERALVERQPRENEVERGGLVRSACVGVRVVALDR